MDVLGKALGDFYRGERDGILEAISNLGDPEEVPAAHFFRGISEMPDLERRALDLSRGNILDVGCGAGSHCLELQDRGMACTGLDLSAGAITVAAERGVRKTIQVDIRKYEAGIFDTILLLMNGAGLAGTLRELGGFLRHIKKLLAADGQILLDSSDLQYLYERDTDGGIWVPADRAYYGELTYQWRYDGLTSPAFPWLFVDFDTLCRVATLEGLCCEQVLEGPHYDYLAKLQAVT